MNTKFVHLKLLLRYLLGILLGIIAVFIYLYLFSKILIIIPSLLNTTPIIRIFAHLSSLLLVSLLPFIFLLAIDLIKTKGKLFVNGYYWYIIASFVGFLNIAIIFFIMVFYSFYGRYLGV